MSKQKYLTKRNDGTPSKRKFHGFGFYLQCNGKLSRKNRKYLLLKSEVYLGGIYESLPFTTEEKMNMDIDSVLDSESSDVELLGIWNKMYEKYGYLIPDFKDKWEKNYLKIPKETFKPSNIDKYESKINELEFRIRQLEMKLSRRHQIQNMG
jgi:hypothetical protein